jgi:sugar/nucleoside kinase (ribokinase family)
MSYTMGNFSLIIFGESMSLLVLGSLALDTIETPTQSVAEVPGGSATFAALSASYFTNPHIIGIIGSDFPSSVNTLLLDHQVRLEGVEVKEGKTLRWGGRYSENFDERITLFIHLNVFEDFSPTISPALEQAETILLANIHPGLQLQVLNQVKGGGFIILDTMNLWIDTAHEELMEVIGRADMLVINNEESFMLTGERQYARAAAKLADMGPDWIVIKKGQHGAMLFHEGQVFTVPALALDEVKDPTGAGDCFVGAMAGYLDQSQDRSFDNMKLGLVYGTILASFCVEDFSVHKITYLEKADLEKRYDELVLMSQF